MLVEHPCDRNRCSALLTVPKASPSLLATLLSPTESLDISVNPGRILEFTTGLEEFVELVARVHVLKKGNRSGLRHDDVGRTAHHTQPFTELFRVGNSCRQRHEFHCLRQMEDDFLPDRPAKLVRQVVDLVEHHEAKVREQVALCIEHVSQNFGCHDDDSSGGIDARVPREQADFILTVDGDQVLELLVGQGLHGCRVEDLVVEVLLREINSEVRDDRFARTRRSGNENTVSLLERPCGVNLERV